jgi:hypothetical protein
MSSLEQQLRSTEQPVFSVLAAAIDDVQQRFSFGGVV